MAVGERSAAALVATGAPNGLDQAFAASNAAVLVAFVLVVIRGDLEGLYPSIGQSHCQKRSGRMGDLGEEVRLKRKSAEVFQHVDVLDGAV